MLRMITLPQAFQCIMRLSLPILIALFLVVVSFASPSKCFSKLAGQLIVDPQNPSWMVYNRDDDKDGFLDPAFICGPGDPEGFLYRGSRTANGTRNGDQQQIINNMAAHGVNSIYIQAIRSHGGDGDSTQNPFINSDPTKGLDEDILSQWDGWLDQLDKAGIVIYFFFYDDSARIWSGNSVGPEEKSLIDNIVARYQHLKHLVWVVAEEYAERYSPERVSNIAAEIKSADSNDHVVANHQWSSLVFDHADDANLDQFALQYNKTTAAELHSGMVTAWNNANGRYGLMMAEAVDHGYDDRATCRQKNWASATGGAYVMVLRMDGTAAYNEKMTDCKTLIRFFESTDFNVMSPHDELGNVGTWVLANPAKKTYIAYRRTAGSFTLSGIISGKYSLTWLDTVSGATVQQLLTLGSGSLTLSKPQGLGDESALWLRAASTVPPPAIASQPAVNALLLGLGEEK